MVQRNRFEMATHNFIHRPKRSSIKATISGKYHNDKPLYWTMALFIGTFAIIALAIIINS